MKDSFADLGLGQELLTELATLGYEEPTPIQKAAIPPLVEGRDLLGQAATGTGKTAAFALPMLQRLIDATGEDLRPTEIRLLAGIACMQIMDPGPEALGQLALDSARDQRAPVRALAGRLLGSFETPQAASALSQLLRDRDPTVQVAAASSLLRLAAAEAPETAQR